MSLFSSWFRPSGRLSSGAKLSSGMKLPPGVRRLFRLPGHRSRILRDLDEEMRIHFAMRVEELPSLGMSEVDAEAEALRRFGDPEEYHDYAEGRAARRSRWLSFTEWLTEWTQDVRFATRQFRKSPGFTAIAVLTLALGIGANTAIFSVVHHLLLAPLPYPDGNRIVKLVLSNDDFSQGPSTTTLQAWHERARSFDMIAAVSVQSIAIESREEQDSVHAFITSNFLQLLGLHPTIGRGFTPEEERPGGPAVAMIGYGLWQRSYGGRADALGSTVHVDGRPYTIVGVAPRDMAIPMSYPGNFRMRLLQDALPGVWLPASLDSMGDADVFAKLRPGVSAQQASRELQAIGESVPGYSRYETQARAMHAQDFLDPREARTVKVLFVAVGVLLLIACANIANLLLSRSWARRREFAVRAALGAGRARLARQILTESVLLALAGGILGVGVAWQTVKIIVALRPPALENLAGIRLESTVLLWSAGISVLTGVLFGCAPALLAGARSVGDVLRSETRGASGGGASRRMRSALIVLEIAMSLVLLIGAGLLVRSFVALQQIPLGFDPHGLVTVDVMLPRPTRQGLPAERRRALRAAVLERLRAVPGVIDAAVGTLPGDAYGALESLSTEPATNGYSRSVSQFSVTFMSPSYFRVAGMSLVQGRLPDSVAWASSPNASPFEVPTEVVVNRGLARRFWPDGRAVGARMHSARDSRGRSATYIVVGVVNDVHIPGQRAAIKEAGLYRLPWLPASTFLVRAAPSEATNVAAALRGVIAEVDPGIIVRLVSTGDDYLNDALAPTRFAMALLTAFALIALVLSAVGLYGVIAYSVTQRKREIGVRIALGAQSTDVAGLVIGEGLRLVAAGIVIGMAGAIAATRALRGMLYGVGPADPATFGAIVLLLGVIAMLASYVPARRALRVDPLETLREV